jgi:hypothetical protein
MKRTWFNRILFLGILILIAGNVRAEEKPLIEVKAQVDTATITIGDHITYSIIIDRRKDVRIIQPGPGINLGMFEIKSYNFHKPMRRGDRIVERYDYVISVYDTGKYVIPPYPLAYFLSDTATKPSIIQAPAITIYVKSLLKGEKKHELKDIKPPLSIPFNYRFWLKIAGLVILAVLLLYLGYWLWKRKQERGFIFTPPPPPPPAHEKALKALQELYASDLLQKGNYKEFFSRLSEIMRAYLEGRYYIRALEETTSEIMSEIPRVLPEQDLQRNLEDLLTLSDLVKFAKYIPQQDEVERVKKNAVDFVQQTKIVYTSSEDEAADEAQSESAEEEKVKQLTSPTDAAEVRPMENEDAEKNDHS